MAKNVRFVARPGDLHRPHGPVGTPAGGVFAARLRPDRLVDARSAVQQTGLAAEKRGYDVLPQTAWIPVVTFLQVSADMAVAVDVPDGHGHHYVADVANGWAAVLSPPGWTPEKTERLRPLLHADG